MLIRVLLLLAAGRSAMAHHSFGAAYDSSQVVTVTGIVTRFAFKVPHLEIDIVEKASGEEKSWKVEAINPRLASSYGLNRSSLRVGDHIEVMGWPARDGADQLGAHKLTFPDGTVFVFRRSIRSTARRFRSIHGFTGEKRSPTPLELAQEGATREATPRSAGATLELTEPEQPTNRKIAEEEVEDPQLEFVEQMEEASFAVSALVSLLENRESPKGQRAEIENLQVALFNSKVLMPLIALSESAIQHHGGDEAKARAAMKQSLVKAIKATLTIENHIVAGEEAAALSALESLRKHQHATHRIFQ